MARRVPRIVLDTSALIAALRSRRGAAASVLKLVLSGEIGLILSYSLACEYRDVGERPTHIAASGRSTDETERLIAALENTAEPVAFHEYHGPMSADRNDDMVLETAINGRADLLVTHNVRHLREAAARFHISLVTPGELLKWIAEGGLDG